MNTNTIRRDLRSILHERAISPTSADFQRQFAALVFQQVYECLDFIDRIKTACNGEDPVALIEVAKMLPRAGGRVYPGCKVFWRSQDPTTMTEGRTVVFLGLDYDGTWEATDENGEWIPTDFVLGTTREAARFTP